MATRRYKISPGMAEESVIEEVGAATNSNVVELTIDLSSALITEGSSTRSIQKEEVLIALKKIENYILKHDWVPA